MPEAGRKRRIRWTSREIAPPANYAALRREIGAVRSGAILESAASSPKWGRYSIFAAAPVRRMTVLPDENPFDLMCRTWPPWSQYEPTGDLPFVGGWIGYISYEAGKYIEPTAGWSKTNPDFPLTQWTLYDTVLLHDTEQGKWHVAGVTLPKELSQTARAPLKDRLGELADCVAYLDVSEEDDSSLPPALGRPGHDGPEWNYSRDAYLSKVDRILVYIRAGDIFQANLSRRLRVPMELHPFSIFERLSVVNPATHAAYLPVRLHDRSAGPAAIISSSPELFLHLRAGEVTTRPIKGTRSRGASPEADRAASQALAASEKDRAELNMIIDLERNDLGRVCEYGTIRVVSDGDIETMPTVFHRTATITGRLRPGLDAIDLLRATFPGGSVTGAPKVRAMQIIDELEPDARGPYCGAIGYVGLDGSMHLNLPIRTMIAARGAVDLHVGGGIVADSTPEQEYAELQAKAAGMLRAIGLDQATERQPAEMNAAHA